MDGRTEVQELLALVGLSGYDDALASFGIDCVADLRDKDLLSDDDLLSADINMKKAHVRKLRRHLQDAQVEAETSV